MLIQVRTYDRRDDGTFPTRKGIALNLEKWKKLQYCYLENIDGAVDLYQDSNHMDLFIHLGGNYHVSVKTGCPLVNIRLVCSRGSGDTNPENSWHSPQVSTVGETKIGYVVRRMTFER